MTGGPPGSWRSSGVLPLAATVPLVLLCVHAVAGEFDFAGTWETTYGRMVLTQDGNSVSGWYTLGGGLCTVEGTVDRSGRLEFRYEEPSASGAGWFELSDDGGYMSGEWHVDGSSSWYAWEGFRQDPSWSSTGLPSSSWLVVLEAEWQESMDERDFSFGEMLTAWFERVPGVEVRHRFVHDEEDVARFCFEAAGLPGTVYLVLASHGSTDGLELPGGVMDAEELLDALAPLAGSMAMLHFSSCEVMAGSCASTILGRSSMDWRDGFVVSGYDRSVDWHLSAVIEIFYYNLILEQGMEPAAAAETVLEALSFAGTSASHGLEPSGFTWMSVEDSPIVSPLRILNPGKSSGR